MNPNNNKDQPLNKEFERQMQQGNPNIYQQQPYGNFQGYQQPYPQQQQYQMQQDFQNMNFQQDQNYYQNHQQPYYPNNQYPNNQYPPNMWNYQQPNQMNYQQNYPPQYNPYQQPPNQFYQQQDSMPNFQNDNFYQYNYQDFKPQLDVLNKSFMQTNNKDLNIHKDNQKHPMIFSKLMNIFQNAFMNEEEEPEPQPQPNQPYQPQIPTPGPQPGYNNWFNKSFVPTRTYNQVDDLQQLLQKSEKYNAALMKSRLGKYADSDFPADHTSIIGYGEGRMSTSEAKRIKWCRPEEIFSHPKVFDTIDPDDILQGSLGDCYFLAAIASIAQNPKRLERIFLTKKVMKEGIYVMAMCINGIWQEIVLDDYLPCQPYSKKPIFNSTKTDELWVMFLEKAWAKVHGGYMNINAGLTREALRDLTGASAKTFFTQSHSESEQWEIIKKACQNNYILTAGSDDLNYGRDDFIEKIGIAGSHAYSLLGVYELQRNGRDYCLKQGNYGQCDERIIKLRNPWGKGEWSGNWSDNSPLWNANLRQQLKLQKKEDGIFFMPFKEFRKYFSDFQICYYHDNYCYSAIQLQSQKNKNVFVEFDIQKPGKYYFSVNQKNRRFFKKSMRYNYSDLSQLIGAVVNGQSQYIGSSVKSDKENWIEKDCQPGKYICVFTTPWKSFVNEFSFSVYGPQTVNIKQIQRNQVPALFFQNIFKRHAQDNKEQLSQFSGTQVKYKQFKDNSGFGYIYVTNEEHSKVMDVTVEFTSTKNYIIMEPYRGRKPKITLQPQQSEVVVYEPVGYPCSLSVRLMATEVSNFTDIVSLAKSKGSKLNRTKGGRDVGIYIYSLRTKNSMVMHYVNNSSGLILREYLELGLDNCYIEGSNGNYLEIVVKPKEENTIQVIRDKENRPFSVSFKKLDYNIDYY